MKSKSLLLAGTYMFLSVFAACTDEASEQSLMSGELMEVTATADKFKPEVESRGFYLDGNSVEFTWVDGDTIGIFPTTGAQAYFPILVGSETTNSASFTGGGWALKSSAEYASYYPFIGDFYLDKTQIPVSYVGQKQTGDATLSHLNGYDYMTATATSPTSGKVNFQFKHLGAFVQLKITMPQGGTLSSVTLSADEAVFTTEGTYDLTAATPAITATQKSKTLTLEVEDVTTTAESNVATLYMMLAPVDFTDKTLSAIVKTSNGNTETITLTGKNFEAGKAYGVSGTMKDPNGGVTAGDGTYANGVVSVDVAGNMKSLLGSDYLNITELKVVGPINGDDVRCLRQMLGGSEFSNAEKGNLEILDLSEATIIEGGEWYYNDSYEKYYTSNDVIGANMFYKCANLHSLILPNNITTIGVGAFYNCSFLTSIDIPKGVTSIGGVAFEGCSSLEAIDIPNSVTSISAYTFYGCSSLTSATIGTGITSIEDYAFKSCSSLVSVNMSDGITSIGNYAFDGCFSLESINIPNSVISIGNYAFYNCSSMASVTIGTGTTSIGDFAFKGCSSLKSINIPNSVISIGNYAFSGCSSLESIIIPSGVTSIGKYSFEECSFLTSIKIPDSVISIGNYAFYGCSSLASVKVSNGVTSISEGTFANCSSLDSIDIPDGVTSLNSYAFFGCTSLTSIDIPNGVTLIGEKAFYDCYELTSVTIDNYNTSIGEYAFRGCSAMTSVTIKGFTSIGTYAFGDCISLSSILITGSITSISNWAFNGCTSLSYVYIPSDIKTIGAGAFLDCPSLMEFSCPTYGGPPEISSNSFDKFAGRTLYIRSGLTSEFKEAGWNSYFQYFVEK